MPKSQPPYPARHVARGVRRRRERDLQHNAARDHDKDGRACE